VATFIEKLTGEKLMPSQPHSSSIPPSDAAPNSGFKVPTAKEAFAQTMHSGDFGIAASTPRPRLPTPIPIVESPPANPVGATMESLPPPVETVAEHSPLAPRRSLVPVIAIAIASAAVGALVLYLVTRGPSEPTSRLAITADAKSSGGPLPVAPPPEPDAAVVVETTPDAAAGVADAAAVVVADAAPVVADAAPIRRAPDARVAPPPEPADGTGPGAADVVQAQRALGERNFDAAERLAGSVIVSPDTGAPQKARARMIRGIVRCVARNNEEAAGLDLKAIPRGFRQLRATLISSCQAQGYLKEETP